jgi:hypothetical protein
VGPVETNPAVVELIVAELTVIDPTAAKPTIAEPVEGPERLFEVVELVRWPETVELTGMRPVAMELTEVVERPAEVCLMVEVVESVKQVEVARPE